MTIEELKEAEYLAAGYKPAVAKYLAGYRATVAEYEAFEAGYKAAKAELETDQ